LASAENGFPAIGILPNKLAPVRPTIRDAPGTNAPIAPEIAAALGSPVSAKVDDAIEAPK